MRRRLLTYSHELVGVTDSWARKAISPARRRALDKISNMARILAALMLALVVAPVALGGVTPELQRAIRASTFEVVLKKPTHDPVSYEKPLPLELLPYVERTDPYQSVGTAFALGQNTYVTAAHVLTAAVDSQYGAP